MEYNSQREHLILREYGRNVQSMIEYAAAIKDLNERQKAVEYIIHIMGSLNPHLKNVDDFAHLLWDHLYIMADFNINVASPYPIPEKEKLAERPKKFDYPTKNTRFRHYGRNILAMIENASEMEDAEKKEGYTKCIANYMKKVHNNWNRENVTDEIILEDLVRLSGGKLSLGGETTLNKIRNQKKPTRNFKHKKPTHSNNNNRRKQYTKSR